MRERSLAPDDVSRADLVDVDADDLRSLLGRWDPTCPLSIRFASAERAHEIAELARGAGLEVLLPLPALGALVRWPEGGALCPLARGFFAAKPGVLADVVVAPHDPDHPLVRAILEQARHPTDLFERALDAALEPAVRLALLHAALADAAREVDADPVGAQLTRARLALELGLRGASPARSSLCRRSRPRPRGASCRAWAGQAFTWRGRWASRVASRWRPS